MKLNETFLKFYNATFDFIERQFGYDSLVRYWRHIAPYLLSDLIEHAKEKGVVGCAIYWKRVLSEEGIDFFLTVNDHKYMKLEIKNCASLHKIGTPCKHYCEHCKVMYESVLQPLGLDYKWKKTGAKSCEIVVSSL